MSKDNRDYREKYPSLKLIEIGMSTLGVGELNSTAKSIMLKLATLLNSANFIFYFLLLAGELYYGKDTFLAFTESVCLAIPLASSLCKTAVCLLQKRNILRVMRYAQKHFWESTTDPYYSKLLTNADKKAMITLISCTVGVIVAASSYTLKPYLKEETTRDGKPHIFHAMNILPPQVILLQEKPTIYWILYICESQTAVFNCLSYIMVDFFLCLMSLHVSLQFRTLKYQLQNAIKEKDVDDSTTRMSEAGNRMKRLIESIKRHNNLTKFVGHLNKIGNKLVLSQVLFTILLSCFALNAILVTENLSDNLKFMSDIFVVMVELYVIAQTMDEVMRRSSEISDSCYNVLFYKHGKMNKSYIQCVRIIMCRSQKPSCLTVGGVMPMTRAVFLAVLTKTSSVFTVLRQFI